MDTYRSYENFEKNCNSLADLLKKYPYTDGFFGSDLWAVVAVKTALKLGYKIPKDFKIIGYDGTILSEITTPSITTVSYTHLDVYKRQAPGRPAAVFYPFRR